MSKSNKYDFSFTASSLRINEMVAVAAYFKERKHTESELVNQIGNGKLSTGKRIYRECKKRLSQLTENQKKQFIEGDLITQKQTAFLAIAKLHRFIKDFTVEILREKLLLFDYHLTDGEYVSFYNRKTETNPELETFTENTKKKIKQVTFKILEQSGIIDNVKTKTIQPQIMNERFKRVIVEDNPEWLKIFLLGDSEIEEILN